MHARQVKITIIWSKSRSLQVSNNVILGEVDNKPRGQDNKLRASTTTTPEPGSMVQGTAGVGTNASRKGPTLRRNLTIDRIWSKEREALNNKYFGEKGTILTNTLAKKEPPKGGGVVNS